MKELKKKTGPKDLTQCEICAHCTEHNRADSCKIIQNHKLYGILCVSFLLLQIYGQNLEKILVMSNNFTGKE